MAWHLDMIALVCGSLIALAAVGGWLRARRGRTGGDWVLPAGVAVIILAGWLSAQWRGSVLDDRMRREVLREATCIARAIDPRLASSLSFTAADQAAPAYQRICAQLRSYSKQAGLRSVYSLALRDGRMVFGPENIDPQDAMASPPGTPYEEPSASDWQVFQSRQAAAFGPVTDEYGTFICGLAPVLDPRSGEVLFVIGVDLPAGQWQAAIVRGKWQVVLIALALASVLAAGLLLRSHAERHRTREGSSVLNADSVLAGIMGVMVTAIAAVAAHDVERRTHAQDFERLADATAGIATDAFRDVTREIGTLARFFRQSDFVDAREFEGFAASPVLSHGVQALAWTPLVTADGRERFEAGMRQQGPHAGGLFEWTRDGTRLPAQKRDLHCPVAYITPVEGNEDLIGLDLASEAGCWAAMERSMQTKLSASTAPMELQRRSPHEKAVLLLHPVFRTGQERAAGFAVGVLRLQDALAKAMGAGGRTDSYAQVQLADLGGGGLTCLAEYPQRPGASAPGHGIMFPLFVSGNSWAVVVRPGPGFMAAHGMRAGPATALGGLTVSLAIAAAVGIQRNRRFSLERQVRDRTCKLQESERTLRASEAKLHAIIDSIQTGLLLLDAETHTIVEINPAAERMIGADRDRIVGRTCHSFVCPAECGKCPITDLHQTVENSERVLLTASGAQRAIIKNATVIDLNGRPHILESFIDITDRKSMEEKLRAAARTDRLTGLANRAMLTDQLEQAICRANCVEGHRFAALFFDMDRFKVINDSLGHRAGDALLVEVAGRLRQAIAEIERTAGRPGMALASRLGGDEFVVVLEGLNGHDEAIAAAEAILTRLASPYHLLGRDIYSTASMGIVMSDMAAHRAEDILRDADTAMYEAKTAGKGRHVLFDATMRQRAHDRLALESDLRQALELEQFHLVYQPIVSLEDGTLESFEALLRWRHPQRGLVSPADFIPIAEECGLIVAIGEWVLREACRQQERWQRAAGGAAAPRMSINLSRVQLMQPDLPERIARILAETGANPARLHLEITESAIMRDQQLAIRTLQKLRDLGLKLDLDDFGTGYSSLASLHLFPLDVLKIDRSFVANIGRGRDFAALVHAVAQLARNLGIAVVAEGIETVEQLQMLQALDCQFGQGYLFARPLSAEQAIAFHVDLPSLSPGVAA